MATQREIFEQQQRKRMIEAKKARARYEAGQGRELAKQIDTLLPAVEKYIKQRRFVAVATVAGMFNITPARVGKLVSMVPGIRRIERKVSFYKYEASE